VAHPDYIREKAIQMRIERRLSIDEIAERLALPKTTIYYWVKDIPLLRPRRRTEGQRRGNERMQARWKARRDQAYDEGLKEAPAMLGNPSLRDFVNLYIGEGSKRCRNTVAICNSDPEIMRLGARWIRRLTTNKIQSNSNQLSGRTRRSKYGVLAVSGGDTCLRSRIQAWMDVLRDAWDLDWTDFAGCSEAW
jgi:hypothetical protein